MNQESLPRGNLNCIFFAYHHFIFDAHQWNIIDIKSTGKKKIITILRRVILSQSKSVQVSFDALTYHIMKMP